MADNSTRELRGWALKGAEQRLLEIAAEAEAIYRNFPELRQRGRRGGAGRAGAAATADQSAKPAGATRRRRRRKMSAEARQRIADAQRRRWAAQKAAAGTGNASDEAGAPAARAPKKR